MHIVSFTKFLKEDEFVGSTDQNKTVDHVKHQISKAIAKPTITLKDNGVEIQGTLTQSLIKSESNVLLAVNKVITNLIQFMVDDQTTIVKVAKTSQDDLGDDSTSYTINYLIRGNQYTGNVDVVVNQADDQFTISIVGNWREL